MANPEHLAMLMKGVRAWNDWRKANPVMLPDLREAELTGANLTGADLIRVRLNDADLSGANLWDAHLHKARLNGVDLREANLRWADLSEADVSGAYLGRADLGDADLTWGHLRDADLHQADLSRANLSKSDLSGADITGAVAMYTIFGDNDLSHVKGLETVQHHGPSTIGIDTIYRSHGNIPLAFLRGAGVPDNFIEYMGSLTGKALEFYSCFISYSTKDQEFADRLHADLQNKGVRCWFAPQNLRPGKKLKEQIDNAIRMHERLLLILSADSINSNWVKTEIIEARKREIKENRRVLFPVSIVPFSALKAWEFFDADEGKDLAKEIREYYMPPDFSEWENHKSYTKGLNKLLDGLKTEGSEAA